MGKIKKFAQIQIQKIIGGRDPVRIAEEFLLELQADPDKCKKKDSTSDSVGWLVPLGESVDLEVLLENLKKGTEATIYLGVNVIVVPVRGSSEMLAAALEVADGLVGIKVSLVGHYLVLSATLGAHEATLEDLKYHYRLITAQRRWFIDALFDELGIEEEEQE